MTFDDWYFSKFAGKPISKNKLVNYLEEAFLAGIQAERDDRAIRDKLYGDHKVEDVFIKGVEAGVKMTKAEALEFGKGNYWPQAN